MPFDTEMHWVTDSWFQFKGLKSAISLQKINKYIEQKINKQ
jgi:hypothetical protein